LVARREDIESNGCNGPEGARLLEVEHAAEIASIRKDIVNFYDEIVLVLNFY
jgi:hypothetical protein